MKRFASLAIVVTIIISLFGQPLATVKAENSSEALNLKGVAYGEGVHPIYNEAEFDSQFIINGMDIVGSEVTLNASILHKDQKYNLQAQGKVYNSENLLLKKSNSITIDFKNANNELEFLSFVIEKSANERLLLPVNSGLSGKEVIKIAVRDTRTNQIFYFEDSFNKSTNNSLKLTNVQSVAINANSTKVENEDESELFRVKSLEEWYHFYANEYNSKVNNNVNSNNLAAGYETMAVSPIPGVPTSAFTTLGASKDLSNDAYSYYKRTYIYPINPDLFITTIMKISFVHNKSNFPSGVELANGTVDLHIVEEAELYYDTVTDQIDYFSPWSFWRIRNSPAIEMGLGNGNSQIISSIQRFATTKSGTISFDWQGFVGALPFGNTYTTAVGLFNALVNSWKIDSRTSQVINYHTSVQDNETVYGDSVRAHRYVLGSSEYLETEGDQIGFFFTVAVPTDKPRGSGVQSMYFKYNVQIYSRSGLGAYSILEDTLEKYISTTYTVSP